MPPPDVGDAYESDSHAEAGLAFHKIIAMALACDLTRSININWGGNSNNRVYSNLGHTDGHHDISHRSDGDSFAQIRAIHRHLWELSTDLYSQLMAVPEGDGTLWDNTLIVHWNELSQGDLHSWEDCMVILAGGAGGHFDQGRYLNIGGRGAFSDMLTNCFHYMGFDDVESFGDQRLTLRGSLDGLTAA